MTYYVVHTHTTERRDEVWGGTPSLPTAFDFALRAWDRLSTRTPTLADTRPPKFRSREILRMAGPVAHTRRRFTVTIEVFP